MAVLETTFIIDLMKEAKSRRPGNAAQKLADLLNRGEAPCTTIFTVAELFVGVEKGTQPERERQAVEQALSPLPILRFEVSTARVFGAVVGQLEKQGQAISDMDALIGSVALERDELLVTRNLRHFRRIHGPFTRNTNGVRGRGQVAASCLPHAGGLGLHLAHAMRDRVLGPSFGVRCLVTALDGCRQPGGGLDSKGIRTQRGGAASPSSQSGDKAPHSKLHAGEDENAEQ